MAEPIAKADATLVLKRTLNCAPARVFAAWTDPELVEKWWGTKTHKCTEILIDLKVGGSYRMALHHLESDKRYIAYGVYKEIVTNRKLVMTWQWEQEGVMANETILTIELEGTDNSTELTLTHSNHSSKAHKEDHEKGWNGCLDRLAEVI
jgi:uncharacterized protein YndB with AHSA1/START domain